MADADVEVVPSKGDGVGIAANAAVSFFTQNYIGIGILVFACVVGAFAVFHLGKGFDVGFELGSVKAQPETLSTLISKEMMNVEDAKKGWAELSRKNLVREERIATKLIEIEHKTAEFSILASARP